MSVNAGVALAGVSRCLFTAARCAAAPTPASAPGSTFTPDTAASPDRSAPRLRFA
ncbi:MAG: hypothetical protein HYX91_02090 [Chloroflexi bacterium]|nr:hypothetical protein [Chloroflexota bacterium]